MSGFDRFKRRKVEKSSTPVVTLQDIGQGVYQVGSRKGGDLTVASPDYYHALANVEGDVIVDNSADLGRFEGGLLLQPDSRVYLGFASPSQHSAMQVASSLAMFHDIAALGSVPFFQRFDMVKLAPNAKPATHKCLRFDFSPFIGPHSAGVPETLDAVKNYIDMIVRQAISEFNKRYRLCFDIPSDRTPDLLSTFFAWIIRTQQQPKLFITVHQLQLVLQRPVDAAVSNGVFPSKPLDNRLNLIRGLFLTPIWKQLASQTGVVRKFLIVGPHLVDSLIRPPSSARFPGLPAFKDLSSHAALHGFSSSQIRIVYALPEAEVPSRTLTGILRYCNIAGRMDNTALGKHELREIYTKESLQSVFAHVTLESAQSNAMPPNFEKDFATSYLKETLEPARRALFPLFLRHAWFRKSILGMLKPQQPESTYDSIGPVFTIPDIVDNKPERTKTFARVFMLGLMAKYERPGKTPVYSLAGGCARAVLQRIADETTVEKYTKPYQRRMRTRGDGKAPEKDNKTAQQDNAAGPTPTITGAPPPVADEDLPALNLDHIDSLILTETSIANLILDHYRPMTNYKQLPKDEAEFQATFVQLLRAALLKAGLPDSFVHHVQAEVWLRREHAPPGASRNIRCDVLARVRFGAVDVLYIFELKYFNPGNTMNATHDNLPQDPRVLESQFIRGRYTSDKLEEGTTPWSKALDHFLRELASMKNLPQHWYADVVRTLPDMAFSLSIDHIRAYYNETPKGMEGSRMTEEKIKNAVDVAGTADTQVDVYGDVAALGVADELVSADQLTADKIATQLGWADRRITDMGPGTTRIICFTVVNVAGALVYVHKSDIDKVVERRIGIVDADPWAADPGEAESTALKKRKQYAARQKV